MSKSIDNDNKDNKDNKDNNLKIVLVGEAATGKTSLINTYLGLSFNKDLESTLTPSVSQKLITIKNIKYIVNIWDTVGQEQYRSITKIFIKGSQIVIFVYDVTNQNSFDNLDYWVKSVEEYLGKEPIYGVIGNKTDLFEQQVVEREKGEKYAQDLDALFLETSAKVDAKGIKRFINELIEEFLVKNGISKIGGERLSSINPKKKQKCSC